LSGKKSIIKMIILMVFIALAVFLFYDANYGDNRIGIILEQNTESKNENAFDTETITDNMINSIPAGSIVLEEDGKSTFIPYGKGFMHFTRDGVKFYSSLGNLSWSDVYSMVSPTVVTGGQFTAVIDMLGKAARVYDENGLVYTLQTEESICYAALNKKGNAVLILNGKDDYKVQVYTSSGKMKFQRFDEDTGVYPVCADISDDGDVLAVSYTDTRDIELLSKVLFFHTSKDADNKLGTTDMFAACEVKDEIIANITNTSAEEFVCVSDKALFAVNTSGETVWRGETGNEINNVAVSEGGTIAIGLGKERLDSESVLKEGTVQLYNFGGKKTGEVYLNGNISSLYLKGYYLVACSDEVFYGIKANGNIIWEHNPSGDVKTIIPMDNSGKVLYITSNYANIENMS